MGCVVGEVDGGGVVGDGDSVGAPGDCVGTVPSFEVTLTSALRGVQACMIGKTKSLISRTKDENRENINSDIHCICIVVHGKSYQFQNSSALVLPRHGLPPSL